MKTQFEQMMDGLNAVEAFLAGEQECSKAHVPDQVDVQPIRNRLGMTQARFSNTFGFSLDAIKHWEGGRRIPEAPARTLLTVIDKNPAAVLTALSPVAFAAAVGFLNPPPSMSGLLESVRHLVALQTEDLFCRRAEENREVKKNTFRSRPIRATLY